MPTRNVVLSEHHHHFVEELVQSGRYQNASEVLREGLRLVERQEQEQALKLEALKRAVQEGMDDLAAGHYTDVDDAGLDAFIADLGDAASASLQDSAARRIGH